MNPGEAEPSRFTGTGRSDSDPPALLWVALAFGAGLFAAIYLWFPGQLLERRVGGWLESKLPGGTALETFDYRPPFTLEVTPVTEVAGRRVSLPLRIRPGVTSWDLGLAFEVPPGPSISGAFWLWGRHLELEADRFRLARVLPVEGRLTGRLEATLVPPSTGRFEVAATFPELVLFRTIPGVQDRLTLERVEADGELEGRRITVRGATFRGEELRGEADGEVELRTPLRTSSVRLAVRVEQPVRQRYEQAGPLGGLLDLLGGT